MSEQNTSNTPEAKRKKAQSSSKPPEKKSLGASATAKSPASGKKEERSPAKRAEGKKSEQKKPGKVSLSLGNLIQKEDVSSAPSGKKASAKREKPAVKAENPIAADMEGAAKKSGKAAEASEMKKSSSPKAKKPAATDEAKGAAETKKTVQKANASSAKKSGSAAKAPSSPQSATPKAKPSSKSKAAEPSLSAVAVRKHGPKAASNPRPVSAAHKSAQAKKPKKPAPPEPRRPMTRAELRRLAQLKKDRKIVALLGVLVALVLGLFVRQFLLYRDFDKMREAVEIVTFYDGTYVDGINVSGLTLEAAQTRWADEIEPSYSGRTVTLSEGGSVTAAELGYSSDFMEVLEEAWNSARSGSLEERYRKVTQLAQTPENFPVTRSLYDPETLDSFVENLSSQIETSVKEAGIDGFDETKYTFVYTEGTVGKEVDEQQIAADIAATMEAGGGNVTIDVVETHPTTTIEDVKDNYGLISYAITDASTSKASRLSNIKLAMDTINGYCLEPGETFSFNEVVGERTTARGYKEATAYSGGSVVQEVGGGICQVSSTLFNAAVKANLEIVERHEHSMEVSYVGRGKDATVDWGNKDLKFKNTSDEPVYIACLLDGSKNVRIGIYGRFLPDGMYITLETSTVSRTQYETQYKLNPSLPFGAKKVTRSGKYSYVTDTYRVVWSADGKELDKTYMFRSKYDGRSEIVEYGG